jgi:DNA-binding NarL/FixJ family response regulator
MIRVAVVSADDIFHRRIHRSAPEAGLRVDLRVRSAGDIRSVSGIDVVILDDPSAEEADLIQDAVDPLPVVVVALRRPAGWIVDNGWAVVPADDPGVVIAAARAVALGLRVFWNEFEPDDRRAEGTGNGELTERETEVLRLAASGSTNQEIAAALHISLNTVKYHLARVYSSLGVSRRSEMVFEAIRRGLIAV